MARTIQQSAPDCCSWCSGAPRRLVPRLILLDLERQVAAAQELALARDLDRLLHLVARDVGGELHALDLEPELVRVGGALERLVERDQAALVELEERLVEGLHPVLAGAEGD